MKIDIENNVSSSILSNVECHNTFTSDNDIWHKRLGHVNRHSLKLLNLPFSSNPCKECIERKIGRLKFGNVVKKSRQIGELIHTDIAGLVQTPTFEGYKYFQVLLDDFSHFLEVRLLKHKGEAQKNVIDFIKLIKT